MTALPPTPSLAIAPAAAAMFAADTAAKHLGMQLLEARPGYAKVVMPVVDWMINGHNTGHGGITFTLADAAFAFACNAHNIRTVALEASIHFTKAVRLGDTLTAIAEQDHDGRVTGVYRVTVTNQTGETVALLTMMGYRLLKEPPLVAEAE